MQTTAPKAVILAGGMGTRLQPYTFFVPKPLLPLGDKPLIEHLILWLKKHGVKEFVVSVSYLRKMIESYLGDGTELGVKISFVRSPSPMGISGQLLNVKDKVKSTFFLLYGDSVFDFQINKMLEFHKRSKATLTMGLMHYDAKLPYGLIERDKDGRVLSWKEKPEIGGLINVGCYVSEPTIFKYIPKGRMYGFDSVVRDMMKAGENVSSYVIEGQEFMDIGDERSYRRVYDIFLQKMGKVL
ncbi:MAG TPA: nucleotidyltransferase family protein [Nitrososphaerales archaeon]|nr:nucleotidyltransferase family protein [Nitrososphaerales archaeon]